MTKQSMKRIHNCIARDCGKPFDSAIPETRENLRSFWMRYCPECRTKGNAGTPAIVEQPQKRIHSVTIKRMIDESPDTSYLGEYASKPTSPYSIDRAHSLDCASIEANHRDAVDKLERAIAHLEPQRIHASDVNQAEWEDLDQAEDVLIQAQDDVATCDCGERGDLGRNEYRYFNPNAENYSGCTPDEIRKYCRQDYERMESMNRGDWSPVGIRADAEIAIPNAWNPNSWTMQSITSGGLWGIESDSDASYFAEVEQEELSELRAQLTAIGFSKRAISAAFRNIEHKDE